MSNINNLSVHIKSKIYTIREQQIMIDSDLALLYQVEIKTFNQSVKRNIKRFPERFRFQLTKEEYENILRSQNVTFKQNLNNNKRGQHRKYLPYVFTEQGVSMLSAILKSDIAIDISIQIMDSFVNIRKYISSNNTILERFERIENRLHSHDNNFNQLFKALEEKNKIPEQIIFFDGKIFDGYSFIIDIIKSAKQSIVLIDGYIDNTTFSMLSNNQNANISIISHKFNNVDIEKYNKQYNSLKTIINKTYHDRYLIIDNNTIYNIGASIKDVGIKTFTISLLKDFKLNDIIKPELLGELGVK